MTLPTEWGNLPDMETLVQTGSHERAPYRLKSDFLSIVRKKLDGQTWQEMDKFSKSKTR